MGEIIFRTVGLLVLCIAFGAFMVEAYFKFRKFWKNRRKRYDRK